VHDTVTYVLSVSPNSWNTTTTASVTPVVTITKYVGNTATRIVPLFDKTGAFSSFKESSGTTSGGAKYKYRWYDIKVTPAIEVGS
jgi:hypothetical protein